MAGEKLKRKHVLVSESPDFIRMALAPNPGLTWILSLNQGWYAKMMTDKRTAMVIRRLGAIFASWILLQFLIGPIAFLNSKIPIPLPVTDVMEKSVFLPAWLATRNSHFNDATMNYVRWWIPASEEGWCGLELLSADAEFEKEPWLKKQQNTTNQAMDSKGSVTAR
jgi:hypothetical protein